MTMFKLGTIVLALAATLAFASSALAKGGTGGGGGSCAQILSFSLTPGYSDGQPSFTTSYSINNSCVDHENMSTIAIDYSSDATGFIGRAVTMASYGLNTYSHVSPATAGVTYTLTLTVYTPGGKVADTQTLSVTAPPALVAAAA